MRDGYSFPSRQLVSQADSAMVERSDIPRSKFTGSWSHLTTFNAGQLIPFLVDEVLPGDALSYDVTAYVRMATPLFPMFSNQRLDTFFFFVPNRIVWSNWVRMMGEQDRPTDSVLYTVPQITVAPSSPRTLFDYFGIPIQQLANPRTVNALPFRAYKAIYLQWFRDENLIDAGLVPTGDGPDTYAGTYAVYNRAKSHDYFTSCLPFPSKNIGGLGTPIVPIGGSAPVTGIARTGQNYPLSNAAVFDSLGGNSYQFAQNAATVTDVIIRGTAATNGIPNIRAEFSSGLAFFNISDFRYAWAVQMLLERDARGGTRYVESLKMHFGVTSPDFRLQRPEYIGGGSTQLAITPIAQTAPTAGVPLGALGAAATATGQHRATYAATEHGFVIGIINVRSELAYQQGMHRMWDRKNRYEYYYPAFAGLSDQAVLRQEIWCNGLFSSDTTVFGYQERWHEYRTRTSMVTGLFRSGVSGSIDSWHLAQQFSGAPTLGQTFIEDTPPMSRVLAAGAAADGVQYLADILIHRSATRALTAFGSPATIGRF